MYLHYNEVGKSTIDVFNDQLDINYPNIVNNHYIGPDIRYYNSTEHCFGDNFLIWCKDKNIDPYRKQNGLGLYPVGTYTTNFTNDDFKEKIIQSNNENPQNISVYIHIPFCPQICHFCGCSIFST